MNLPLRLPTLVLLALALAPAVPAQKPDLAAAEKELDAMFERPQGTPISDAQKDKLAAFLERHAGQDLAHLGYAKALHLYLTRDYEGAVKAMDEFLARHPVIKNPEHRTMAGRVYVNVVALEARKDSPDATRLTKWAENMTRLYGDVEMLTRQSQNLLTRVKDPAALRVALAAGVFQSTLPTESKDAFLKSLYGQTAAPAARASSGPSASRPGTTPALPLRRIPAPTAAAGAPADGAILEVGQTVESFAADKVLNGPERFELESYRGKVVLLDFFATWCPPCRGSVPGLVALQKEMAGDVQVLGITRFYGRGMDFSGPDSKPPHGGKTVNQIDKAQELAVNETFLKVFAVNYPLVFAAGDVGRTRFGVTGIPTVFVVGRDGKLVGKVVGGGEAQHQQLLELVAQARKQKG